VGKPGSEDRRRRALAGDAAFGSICDHPDARAPLAAMRHCCRRKTGKKARPALWTIDRSIGLISAVSQTKSRPLQPVFTAFPRKRRADPVVTFMFAFRHSRGDVHGGQTDQPSSVKKIGLTRWEGSRGRKVLGRLVRILPAAGTDSAHSPTISKAACSSRKKAFERSP
jgi:hypothetical protein